MKAKELRQKDDKALNKMQEELLREQFNLRMQKGMGGLEKTHQLRQVGRDIARIKTLLKEKAKAE